jgi:hypothetical protein
VRLICKRRHVALAKKCRDANVSALNPENSDFGSLLPSWQCGILFYQGTSSMRKIALFIAMLLLPCVSFAGLLSSNSSTTPVSKEYKQQLMGSPVYIEIFKEERMLDLYVKMGETYQLLDSYRICNYSGGLGPNSARAISRVRKGSITSPAAS